jgi:hypothetical protein
MDEFSKCPAFLKGQLKRPASLKASLAIVASITTPDRAINLGRHSNKVVAS